MLSTANSVAVDQSQSVDDVVVHRYDVVFPDVLQIAVEPVTMVSVVGEISVVGHVLRPDTKAR
jgi:hypothetical protein